MKLIVSLIAYLLLPIAAVVVAYEVAKTYIEDRMMPGVE